MKDFQKEFARVLAETGAIFFAQGLRLKDGRPTPYFVNLGLFRTGRLSCTIGTYLARMLVSLNLTDQIDVLVGPSYKGSALAVAAAQSLWLEHKIDLLFDYDRKEAKTYGEATGEQGLFVTRALQPKARVFIVDDVGTTMGTKYDLLKKIKVESSNRALNLTVTGVGLVVDREQTTAVLDEKGRVREGVRGEDAILRFMNETNIPVHSLVGIREVVLFLAREEIPVLIDGVRRPLDQATLDNFNEYMAVYGVVRR